MLKCFKEYKLNLYLIKYKFIKKHIKYFKFIILKVASLIIKFKRIKVFI